MENKNSTNEIKIKENEKIEDFQLSEESIQTLKDIANINICSSISKIKIPTIKIPKVNLPNVTIDTSTIVAFQTTIAERVNEIFYNFGKFLTKCTDDFRNLIIDNISILGKYGWCYLLIDEIMDERIYDLEFPRQLQSSMENNEIGISDIDKYVMKAFTKDVIMSVVENTKLNLDEKDVVKLEKAMINYRARRYYDCASLLSGLIDSQSIKQELFDYKNEKYKPDINGNINKNIDQGWNAFAIVFRNNFSKYFNDQKFIGKNRNNKTKSDHFEEFVNDIKYDFTDIIITVQIINLAYCLLTFFGDSKWVNYPNNKPKIINRNWLMHGMYDIDDITKIDCVKLLLMLNQLSDLYSKLKSGEL